MLTTCVSLDLTMCHSCQKVAFQQISHIATFMTISKILLNIIAQTANKYIHKHLGLKLMLHTSKILLVEERHHHFYNQHFSLFWCMQKKIRLDKFLLGIKLSSSGHSHCGKTKVNFSEELRCRLSAFVWSYEKLCIGSPIDFRDFYMLQGATTV